MSYKANIIYYLISGSYNSFGVQRVETPLPVARLMMHHQARRYTGASRAAAASQSCIFPLKRFSIVFIFE